MFPHTVTIFNVNKSIDNISYHRQIVKNVFYHINKIISEEGKGEKYTYAYDVIFSSEALLKWLPKQDFKNESDTYTLRENDIVVLGEFEEVKDLSDLQKSDADWFLIKTVSENLYGDEELRNIEVTN